MESLWLFRNFKLAAERGDGDGVFYLGYYTLETAAKAEEHKIKLQKYLEAAELFRESINKDPDNPDPFFYLGFLFEYGNKRNFFYLLGMGVERDYKTSYKYFEKAGNLKSGKALTKQATFLIKGIGVENPDVEGAVALFEKAGEFGDEEAYNHLGY